jgi:hypothetical protein
LRVDQSRHVFWFFCAAAVPAVAATHAGGAQGEVNGRLRGAGD